MGFSFVRDKLRYSNGQKKQTVLVVCPWQWRIMFSSSPWTLPGQLQLCEKLDGAIRMHAGVLCWFQFGTFKHWSLVQERKVCLCLDSQSFVFGFLSCISFACLCENYVTPSRLYILIYWKQIFFIQYIWLWFHFFNSSHILSTSPPT